MERPPNLPPTRAAASADAHMSDNEDMMDFGGGGTTYGTQIERREMTMGSYALPEVDLTGPEIQVNFGSFKFYCRQIKVKSIRA